MTATAYPLHWPPRVPRARARERGAFKTTLPKALSNLQDSLRLFASDSKKALSGLVISSNVTLGVQAPADPGVAVWFTWDGMGVCIAVDRYLRVESNLQAIHLIIEARRVELRHGSLELVRATFTGFLALPSATGPRPWWVVLGVAENASPDIIKEAYRNLAFKHHPDRGGDAAKMAEITEAYQKALK